MVASRPKARDPMTPVREWGRNITLLLASSSKVYVCRSEPKFQHTKANLKVTSRLLLNFSIKESQDFFVRYFDEGAEKCFDGDARSKVLYKRMVELLEPSYASPKSVIAQALKHTFLFRLKLGRNSAKYDFSRSEKAWLADVEDFVMRDLPFAREVVASGGANLDPFPGDYEHDFRPLYDDALEMCGDDKETATCLTVKAVNAVLHLYSPETVAEFVAVKAAGAEIAVATEAFKDAVSKALEETVALIAAEAAGVLSLLSKRQMEKFMEKGSPLKKRKM